MIEGRIYGTEISASNLGVVLDTSPSMRPYVEAVRNEITKSFPRAHFREAEGSGLSLKYDYRIPQPGQQRPHSLLQVDDSWYYGEMPTSGSTF